MLIRLGYVAISKTLEITSSHTVTYTNYQKLVNEQGIETANKLLEEITNKNLDNLIEILKYNIKNNIHFYRISSAIFPLVTHPNVKYNPLVIFKEKLEKIGNIVNFNNLRVDIHLDQFCVLNSTNKNVVISTINIIQFFKNMFKVMNIKTKMIIHIGGNTFGKQKSLSRFINNFKLLDKESQKLLIIENDDKIFNIKDTLELSRKLNIPMVLDYHHHICNNDNLIIEEYIEDIFKTWKNETPKIHFSSPKSIKEKRSHHEYININDFIIFIEKLKFVNKDFDIMIEAKEKDYSLFKLVRQLKYKDYKFLDETTIQL